MNLSSKEFEDLAVEASKLAAQVVSLTDRLAEAKAFNKELLADKERLVASNAALNAHLDTARVVERQLRRQLAEAESVIGSIRAYMITLVPDTLTESSKEN